MKAILIDPWAKKISAVEHNGDYREIYTLTDCHTFTCLQVDRRNAMYLDDEGLHRKPQKFFVWFGYPQPLAGKALIVGVNGCGESVSTNWTEVLARVKVTFPDIEMVGWKDGWSETHGDVAIIHGPTPLFKERSKT